MMTHVLSKVDQSPVDLDKNINNKQKYIQNSTENKTFLWNKMWAVESWGQYLDVSKRVSDALPALAVVWVLHYVLCDVLQRAGAALSTHRHHLFAFIKVYCKEVVIRVVYRRPRRVPCESTVLVG